MSTVSYIHIKHLYVTCTDCNDISNHCISHIYFQIILSLAKRT